MNKMPLVASTVMLAFMEKFIFSWFEGMERKVMQGHQYLH